MIGNIILNLTLCVVVFGLLIMFKCVLDEIVNIIDHKIVKLSNELDNVRHENVIMKDELLLLRNANNSLKISNQRLKNQITNIKVRYNMSNFDYDL